jgi:ATP/maltotriose-dependent transcriptional regulator MalT/DNA-binding SARP family transcriptional activator
VSAPDPAPSRPVIVTKLRPPRRRRDILARPRLLALLAANLDRKLILVSAGAGYGKTSLLVDYADAAGLPVCWYRLEPSDADPSVFFEHLIASLREHYPGVGARTGRMLYGEEKLDIEAVVGSLVNEIVDDIPDLFLLVLDDYQHLDDAVVVNAAMDLLLHYLPDNCRVILSSRTLPKKLTLTRLAGEGQVAGLGREALCFTREEIGNLVAHVHGRRLDARQLAALDALSEGWVAALVLASGHLLAGVPLDPRASAADHTALFAYLAQEVLGRQSAAVQSFLLRTSVLETLTPGLCDALLARSDSAAMLTELEEQNLFVVPFAGDGVWYRYHPLFHEFLQRRLAAEPALDVADLHRRAAAWFRAAGLADEAVGHLLQAGDHADAAAAMLAQVNGLAACGRWRQIRQWVEALPAAVARTRPVLLERLGVARVQLGDIREGLDALNGAVDAFTEMNDALGLAQVLVQRGPALRLLGRLAEAEADSVQALKRLGGDKGDEGNGLAAGEAHRNLGACRALGGDLPAARSELEAALRCFEAADNATLAAHTHSDLAALYQLAGDTDTALGHSEAARRHYEAVGNVGAQALAMNNSAMALHAQGRFEAARGLLAEAAALTDAAGAMRTEALVLVGLGDVLVDLGRLDEAVGHYERGLRLARQVGEMPLVIYSVAAWADALRLSGAADEGRTLLAAAGDELAPYHYAYETAHLAYVRGMLALEHLDFDTADEHLATAGRALEELGARREELRARLAGVALADRMDDQATGEARWRAVLARLAGLPYPESLAPAARRLPEVQVRLRQAPARVQRALSGVGADAAAPRVPALAVLDAPGGPESTVELAAPPLTVLALGPPEIRLAGRALPGGAWQTQVARDLFLYLVDRPEGAARWELMAAFWPNSDETRARGALHSTVYRARAVVGKPWLLAEADRYRVPRGERLVYDVAELESKLALARVPSTPEPERIATLEAGLGLVRGPYLDGVADEWSHDRREILALAITDGLVALAGAYLRSGAVPDALATYRRVVDRDPLREDAHRGLMRAYAASGDRSRALVQYERLVAVLDSELDCRPDAATEALERAIRSAAPRLPDEPALLRSV